MISFAAWRVRHSMSFFAIVFSSLASAAPAPEVVPPTEAADTTKVVATIEGAIQQVFDKGDRPSRRDAHAKGHGCVKAEFTVKNDLPAALRHGVFAEPKTFPALIRFSNSAGSPHKDMEGDARGMAIKLIGVPGKKLLDTEADATTQDFVMINYPSFFIDNVANYLTFVQDVLAGKSLLYFAAHPIQGLTFKAFNDTPVDSMFKQRFWSGSPYMLGDQVIKFSARPVVCETGAAIPLSKQTPRDAPDDFLREDMVKRLADHDACFTFMVQPRTNPAKQPIEDASVTWDEADAPFVDVASIRIPHQVFNRPEQLTFCENLSYTPWHALPEHQPIGGINRMRKAVYEAISKLRHGLNKAPRAEPTTAGSEK